MKAEQLYNLDYTSLKTYLLNNKDIAKEILKDATIKLKLINPDNKYEFIWFAQDFNNNLLPYLLDNEGIKVLENSECFEDKMNGLLTSCNPSLPLLFTNKHFNELIAKNIKFLMFYLKSLQPESALNLGIILVKTKYYQRQTTTTKKRMHDTIGLDKDYKKEITYLDKFTQDDKFNRRK